MPLQPLYTQCMNAYAYIHVHVQLYKETVTIRAMRLDPSVLAKIQGGAHYAKFKNVFSLVYTSSVLQLGNVLRVYMSTDAKWLNKLKERKQKYCARLIINLHRNMARRKSHKNCILILQYIVGKVMT